jgi:hypothetical protein
MVKHNNHNHKNSNNINNDKNAAEGNETTVLGCFQLLKREYGEMLQDKSEDGFDVTVQASILRNFISAEKFSDKFLAKKSTEKCV